MSSPAGLSVNDGMMAGEDNSQQYMKVDDINAGTMRRGRGSVMAKFGVQNAYRIVPVHTEDLRLMGIKWRGAFYVGMVLAFGFRSAPYIVTCIADLVEWITKRNYYVSFLTHYLDEFHILGSPGSSICQHNLNKSVDCFSKLGISLHPDKQEGPSTCPTIHYGHPNGLTFYQIMTQWWNILRSDTSRAPTIMSLVRYPSLLAARHSFSFTTSPVRVKSDPIADLIVSLSVPVSALSPASPPHADFMPTQIPQQFLSDLDLWC